MHLYSSQSIPDVRRPNVRPEDDYYTRRRRVSRPYRIRLVAYACRGLGVFISCRRYCLGELVELRHVRDETAGVERRRRGRRQKAKAVVEERRVPEKR